MNDLKSDSMSCSYILKILAGQVLYFRTNRHSSSYLLISCCRNNLASAANSKKKKKKKNTYRNGPHYCFLITALKMVCL